jgi:hypothetical protein
MTGIKIIIGLDLGQQNDYTVLTVIQITTTQVGAETKYNYKLIFLNKFPLKKSYTSIVLWVANFIKETFNPNVYILVVDYGGPGRPVVDLFEEHCLNLVALTTTGGLEATWKGRNRITVPKRDLISSLEVVFQNRRLTIHREINYLLDLEREILNFEGKTKPNNHVQLEAAHNHHDDIIMSLSMAIWYAERCIKRGSRTMIMTGS